MVNILMARYKKEKNIVMCEHWRDESENWSGSKSFYMKYIKLISYKMEYTQHVYMIIIIFGTNSVF